MLGKRLLFLLARNVREGREAQGKLWLSAIQRQEVGAREARRAVSPKPKEKTKVRRKGDLRLLEEKRKEALTSLGGSVLSLTSVRVSGGFLPRDSVALEL